ncbi:fructose-2,6-bisphosphatase [Apilactobacillus kunkeei]|uniref:histidine phosphatase family protein n=1 Tax=Apilactobacillus kunkeei TaxID=148814 RepID=UPI00059B17A8|nr:histidine phosphatase family protein [Apilactobacillus kunkeei]KIM18901.1 fructose-2,6-bisphosphatase [Apilactobacillus kunkeei]MBX8455350.1 histidine phosphatase family protein [Apilactobacillus kunkeei]QYU54867.1 histidine phosphatase family protein [Apilactobacillus kunkeei]CAI2578835.1 Putative phosphoserine phosphatase 2 [Apilactobacillus kunkeei]CAI2579507.1 Putative phosphoserine phosphatase 2 [Apilactobacillus kunkeei]
MTEFYFVRHGKTFANQQGLKQGTINSEITYLSDLGKQQAQHLHDHFDISFADKIYVSPLQRTKDTADYLNVGVGLPIEKDERLLEISYGKWDGQSNAELMNTYPEVFDEELKDVLPSYASLADGETFEHVEQRVGEFMEEIAAKYPDGKLILVSHGFTVKSAMLVALKQQDDPMSVIEPDNTSVTKIRLKNNQYYLDYFNRLH